MAKVGNGTTFTFGGTAEKCTDITFTVNGVEIATDHLTSAMKEYAVGKKDVEISITVIGESAVDFADTGTIALQWGGSGGTDPLAGAVCTSRETGTSNDGEITTTVRFRKNTTTS